MFAPQYENQITGFAGELAATDWWSEAGAVSRMYYTLTTKENMLCVIYYDYLQAGWRLAKVYD